MLSLSSKLSLCSKIAFSEAFCGPFSPVESKSSQKYEGLVFDYLETHFPTSLLKSSLSAIFLHFKIDYNKIMHLVHFMSNPDIKQDQER